MKNRILLILFTIFCIFSYNISYGYEEKEFDIRNVKWGMTKKEVMKSEKSGNLIENKNDSLIYKDNIFDHNAVISYLFNDKKLTGVMILLIDFDNPEQVAELYLKSKNMLANKYKEIPSERDIVSEFESDRSKIGLIGANHNNKLSLLFIYSDKAYLDKKEKDKLDKFDLDKEKF